MIASQRGEPVPRRNEARQRRWQLTSRANLPHLLGVNAFFTQLAAFARTHLDADLRRWWSAARCQQAGAFADHVHSGGRVDGQALPYRPRVRPDGHGIFTGPGRHYRVLPGTTPGPSPWAAWWTRSTATATWPGSPAPVYQYHTCYSRVRYGAHGCDAPGLDAPALDAATLKALHDFYGLANRLIADAISRARDHHRASRADRRAELDAIEATISSKTTARDRCRTAFENGAMDEADAGSRLRELRAEIDALTIRRDESPTPSKTNRSRHRRPP
ncbi:replication-relaxation family protein [Paractinoplanes globisporus]|uniref:Replication-relaxation family protein n=1 Tax=Paractinoplanes globisporus TaxID=113565 RepID=A0ABW6W660_9ACTN